MRWVQLTAALLSIGCQDVTAISAHRLPPPDREGVDDGRLRDPVDPCGALEVSPPQRLSATPGQSDGVRVAVMTRAGEEPLIAVAWIEHGLLEPLVQLPSVDVQLLLPGGVRFGDAMRVELPEPTSIDLAVHPDQSHFLVAVDDAINEALMLLVASNAPEVTFWPLGEIAGTSAVTLPDRILVAGISPAGPGGRHAVGLVEVPADDSMPGVPVWLDGMTAEALVLAAAGADPWLVWIDGAQLLGAPLTRHEDGTWTADDAEALEVAAGELRRAQGSPSPTVSLDSGSAFWVYRIDASGWQPVLEDYVLDEGIGGAVVARGESGARWALVRPYRPFIEAAPEIRLERFQPGGRTCAQLTECVTLTTDGQDSSAPDIAGAEGGYVVAWSDVIDGQKDVFVTFAQCRPTAAGQ